MALQRVVGLGLCVIDHVYLVSCKYLSKVLANAAPSRLFDRGLAGGPARLAGDCATCRSGRWRTPPSFSNATARTCADGALAAKLISWSTTTR